MNTNSQAGASSPRPQSEVERLNTRLDDATRLVNLLTNRINIIADHIVGTMPADPKSSGLSEVSSNLQHHIVDLEKAINSCGSALSRLDNQG